MGNPIHFSQQTPHLIRALSEYHGSCFHKKVIIFKDRTSDYLDFIKTLQPKNICEVGVLNGYNAIEMYTKLNPEKMYLIDLWDIQLQYKETLEKSYSIVKEMFKDNKEVEIIKDYSYHALQLLPKKSLDMIYIDANHVFDGCLVDLELSVPLMTENGIICGHDFDGYCSKYIPNTVGVIDAVIHFCNKYPQYKIAALTDEGTTTSYILSKKQFI